MSCRQRFDIKTVDTPFENEYIFEISPETTTEQILEKFKK